MHGLLGRQLLCVYLVIPAIAWAQFDRRDRRDPALVLETGGRTAYCDALSFSEDGKFLLAAGDDKVVTIWNHGPSGLDAKPAQVLRWPSWREQRGAIYAMALSPNDGGRRIAIGGYGMRTGTVAVLDRESGAVLHSDFTDEAVVITAIAFSADGKRIAFGTGVGTVWIWDMQAKPMRLGQHQAANSRDENWVRLLRFRGDRLLSIAEDGKLVERDSKEPNEGTVILDLGLGMTVRAASLSTDGKWLAAAMRGPAIAVRSLDGNKMDISLPEGQFPMCVAFSADGQRVAAGINKLSAGTKFYVENGGSVNIYDLAAGEAKMIQQLPHSWRAEAVAWQGRERIAVAGGDNHEVKLWDLAKQEKPLSVVQGAGNCIWTVRLSDDGAHLLWQDRRDPNARHPNRRGDGPWKVFALEDRKFLPQLPAKSKIVDPQDSAQGWRVVPDEKDSYVWHALDPAGTKHELKLDRIRDGRPNCFTFLPSADGGPLRLAVGHYWGFSIFTLSAKGATRTRLMIGHQGEVYSLAPSADGSWLVSASNDQTIAAWGLKDWPSQAALGASFDENLLVKSVDVGSPAWEAGLIVGDRIELLAVAGQRPPVLDAAHKIGSRAAALAALSNPEPGKELYFEFRRPGVAERMKQLTTVRQRPLWKFFPSADQRDWVLVMWQGSYYDTSTNGDYLIGWHLNDVTVERQPQFLRAEQLRRQFQNETVIDRLLQTRDVAAALKLALGNNPTPISLGAIEPPMTQLRLSSHEASAPVQAALQVSPRGDNVDFQPKRVELWINDYRFKTWHDLAPGPFQAAVTIEPAQLRAGDNRLTLLAFNRLGGRSDAMATLRNPKSADQPRLVGLSVGINNYGKSGTTTAGGQRDVLDNLQSAVNDARKQREAWQKQAGKLYSETNIVLRLDENAKRDDVLNTLDELSKQVRPDDRLLLFLAGHGDFVNEAGDAKSKSRFVFCGPDYSRDKVEQTGIDQDTLFDKLASVPCRKIVIFDACRSGSAVLSPARVLAPNGQGPLILAACGSNQKSWEHKQYGHGLFTYAILQAFEKGFADADRTGPNQKPDGRIDARELFDYASRQMPGLLKSINAPEYIQVPQCFPRELDRIALIEK